MAYTLTEVVTRFANEQSGESPFSTDIEGLIILRSDHTKPPRHLIFKPSLCVVVQGAKRSIFGTNRYEYGAGQALLVSVEMPAISHVTEASTDEPYLGVIIGLDHAVMREVMEGLDTPPKMAASVERGVLVTNFDGPIADCTLRMVNLLSTPGAISTLYPVIMREICYWLLTGPHGAEVARITLANGPAHHVYQAIHALRARFSDHITIEELAAIAQMSSSAFHRQFKIITSMTPLQYQKKMRLLEARRLMVSDDFNVETAAAEVGYESPSQFSREYSRMFGVAPKRDSRHVKLEPVLV